MAESEIRQNKATREWVVFAPSRGKRPHDFKQKKREGNGLPDFDRDCPFCPGHEEALGSIIMALHGPECDSWQTRVVPNKFPALTPHGNTDRQGKGIYMTMNAYGRHEVIIESPKHNHQIALMSVQEVETIIETYHQRYVHLMKQHENMMTILFRNHGARAGTSLIHPHSQIIVTGMVPQYIRKREEEAQRHFDEHGHCVYCDILKFESRDRRRVILENGSFLAFIPFAADVPFEIWIMPLKHQADFGHISDAEKTDMAAALQSVLSRLHRKLNDPDYNYVITTAARYRAGEPQLHWYLQISPRLTTRAGFEIGSGISINPSLPEQDAEFLLRDN